MAEYITIMLINDKSPGESGEYVLHRLRAFIKKILMAFGRPSNIGVD